MGRFFRFGGDALKKTIGSTQLHALAIGAAAGAMLLAWSFQWIGRLGSSLAVTSALSLAILVGIEVGFRPFQSVRPAKTVAWTVLGCLLFLSLWTVAFPWLIEWQTQWIGAFSPLELSKPIANVLIGSLLCCAISATMLLESRPPLKKAPMGTSLTICALTAAAICSRTAATQSASLIFSFEPGGNRQ